MTQNTDCNKLDAYLADDLSVDDARRFESHLEACSACREAIDEQNWIDSLLQSPARIQIERTPAAILDSFHSSLSQRRHRVWQTACGLAAAAVLVVAVGWLELNRQARLPSISEVQDVAVAEAAPCSHLHPATSNVRCHDRRNRRTAREPLDRCHGRASLPNHRHRAPPAIRTITVKRIDNTKRRLTMNTRRSHANHCRTSANNSASRLLHRVSGFAQRELPHDHCPGPAIRQTAKNH